MDISIPWQCEVSFLINRQSFRPQRRRRYNRQKQKPHLRSGFLQRTIVDTRYEASVRDDSVCTVQVAIHCHNKHYHDGRIHRDTLVPRPCRRLRHFIHRQEETTTTTRIRISNLMSIATNVIVIVNTIIRLGKRRMIILYHSTMK